MPPRDNWGASTPQAKPKPKLRAAATGGPAEGLRVAEIYATQTRVAAIRITRRCDRPKAFGLTAGRRRAAGAPPADQPAAAESACVGAQGAPSPGMFDAVPMFGAIRRPIAASDGWLPKEMLTGQCPSAVVSGCGAPYVWGPGLVDGCCRPSPRLAVLRGRAGLPGTAGGAWGGSGSDDARARLPLAGQGAAHLCRRVVLCSGRRRS